MRSFSLLELNKGQQYALYVSVLFNVQKSKQNEERKDLSAIRFFFIKEYG